MLLNEKWKNRIFVAFFWMILTSLIVSQNVQAAAPIEVGADVSLEIEYKYDGTKIPGVAFDIYKVAEVSESVTFTKTGDFEVFEGTLEGLDENGWKQTAKNIADFVKKREKIEPFASGKTNVEGIVSFPDEETEMTTGLYLVIGNTYEKGGVTYNCDPFLIWLPNLDPDGQWVYDETAAPKVTTNPVKDTPEEVLPDSKLPQTGMLKWPIPVLAGTGLLFFMVGWAKRQKEDN